MKTFLTTCLFIAASSLAFAVEPMPPTSKPEDMKEIGAVKVQDKPIKLELDNKHAEPILPAPPAPAAEAKEHLFGVLLGTGVPHPMNFGLNYMSPSNLWSASVSTGAFSLKYSDIDFNMQNTELGLRYHPWAGSLFVGLLAGTQKVVGKKTQLFTSPLTVTVTGEMAVKSNYLSPHVGWLWGGMSKGFFASVELGAQIPSGVTTDYKDDSPTILQVMSDYRTFVDDLTKESEKYGKMVLPHLAFKFGWSF